MSKTKLTYVHMEKCKNKALCTKNAYVRFCIVHIFLCKRVRILIRLHNWLCNTPKDLLILGLNKKEYNTLKWCAIFDFFIETWIIKTYHFVSNNKVPI